MVILCECFMKNLLTSAYNYAEFMVVPYPYTFIYRIQTVSNRGIVGFAKMGLTLLYWQKIQVFTLTSLCLVSERD